MVIQSGLTHLHYPECGQEFKADRIQTFCRGCQSPMLADYHSQEIARNVPCAQFATRPRGLWRWPELLPVRQCEHRLNSMFRNGMKILSTQREKAQLEEIFAAPEGAATLAVLAHLQYQGWVKPREQIVLGTRLKLT